MPDNTKNSTIIPDILEDQSMDTRGDEISLLENILKPTTPITHALENTTQAAGRGIVADIDKYLYSNNNDKWSSTSKIDNATGALFISISNLKNDGEYNLTFRIDNICSKDIPYGTGKILTFIFSKILHQAYSIEEKRYYKDKIIFTVRELVETGMYTSVKRARQALDRALDFITSIKINGVFERKTGKKAETSTINQQLFPKSKNENYSDTYELTITQEIDWLPLMEYVTTMPPVYWTLKGNATPLFSLIFDQARRNATHLKNKTKDINGKKHKGFEITLSAKLIHEYLILPLPDDIKPKTGNTRIIAPINAAIDSIENSILDYQKRDKRGNLYFDTEQMKPRGTSIEDWLKLSKLTVFICDEWAEPFFEIKRGAQKKISSSKRKKSPS